MGIVRVSGRGQFVRTRIVLAAWRCPEGDASSRWLIDIRTNLLPPMTIMIAVATRTRPAGRERSAGRTGAADRTDRSVRWRRQGASAPATRPQPLQSRANVRPQQQYETQTEEDEGVARRSAAVDAACPAGTTAAGSAPQEHYQEHYEEQEPEYQPSPVHPLHRYAAQHAAPRTGISGGSAVPQYAERAAGRSVAL